MTQQLTDDEVAGSANRIWTYGTVCGMETDLLSLRAAVRRVLQRKWLADEAFDVDFAESYHELTVALDALRAEMAGIDTQPNAGGETKP